MKYIIIKNLSEFEKYYADGEEICTFWTDRLNTHYVFFAVKKDVDKIKRKDFKNPYREDLYGTSVISIQFSKDKYNDLSIKNRYNHSVLNPDATFSNNLDNIAPGLTYAFVKEYHFNLDKIIETDFDLPNYVIANDGKYYKYNMEINGIYYCPDNVIIDDERDIYQMPKDQYKLIDYFVFDQKNKRIETFDKVIEESFVLNDVEKIAYKNTSKNGNYYAAIETNDHSLIFIEVNDSDQMVKFASNDIKTLDSNFLYHNYDLEEIFLPNVKVIGDNCLKNNKKLAYVNFPKVRYIGNDFMYLNNSVREVYLPNVLEVGSYFLYCNTSLRNVYMPKIRDAREGLFGYNTYYHNRTIGTIMYNEDDNKKFF